VGETTGKRQIFNMVFLGILIFRLGFASLIITFTGIIQILTNEFEGNKIEWIFLCMIAFIGPILYLVKGRKLIVKK
jgi:hypothetical protein